MTSGVGHDRVAEPEADARRAFRRGKAYGAIMAEASWILEDNEAINRPLQRLGLQPYRTWRLYGGSVP